MTVIFPVGIYDYRKIVMEYYGYSCDENEGRLETILQAGKSKSYDVRKEAVAAFGIIFCGSIVPYAKDASGYREALPFW